MVMVNKPMIDGIQILRGLAAFLVIVRHGTKEIDGFNFEVGQFGVDLFFVISGFVIYLTSRNVDWRTFAKKRLVRIVPLYWLVSSIALMGAVLLAKGTMNEVFYEFVLSLLFIPHGDLFPILYVGWTLNYEMWFYLIFGALIFFNANLLKGASITIFALVMLGLILLLFNDWEVTPFTVPLLPITLEFLAGVWIAYFYINGFNFSKAFCVFLFSVALIWLWFAPNASAYTVWRPVAWALPAALIVVSVLGLEKHVSFRKLTVLMLLGNASYATYLIHPLIIRFTIIANEKVLDGMLDAWPLLVILILGSILAGLAFHLTFERFLINFFNGLFLNKKLKTC